MCRMFGWKVLTGTHSLLEETSPTSNEAHRLQLFLNDFYWENYKKMYSTKLTVSHSMCSELTPPKNITTLLSFVHFLLHSKSFTSDKSSQKYIVRILLYLLCTTKHVYPLPSPANSRLDFNIKKNKTKKTRKSRGMGISKGLGCCFFLSECLSGNNLTMIDDIPTLHSVQSVYKKMPCMKNTLFG